MLVVETTTRKRVDVVQGYNITAKSLDEWDVVLTNPRPTPAKLELLHDYDDKKDTISCRLRLYPKGYVDTEVKVSDIYAVKRNNVWISIDHGNK